jgi:hypothetical protein
LLDLLWKIRLVGGTWMGTLRNDPSVVVSADSGDKLRAAAAGQDYESLLAQIRQA